MGDDETLKRLALAILLLILLSLIITATGEASYRCLEEWYWPECDDGNIWNGYWWFDEVFVPGYISVDTWFMPAPNHFRGRVVYYDQGIMEATAAYRGLSLDGYVDGVALMSPADIGREVWIKYEGSWDGPFLVVDCAGRGDMWPVVVHRGEAVEVGWKTALRWGLEPPFPSVEVAKGHPRKDSLPIPYPLWFLSNAEFSFTYGPRVYFRPPNEWRIDGEWQTFFPVDAIQKCKRRKNGCIMPQ